MGFILLVEAGQARKPHRTQMKFAEINKIRLLTVTMLNAPT
jgi:hypothetical protein